MMTSSADDNLAYRYPVSVKGIILFNNGDVPLLLNPRNEYELPGGKLEPNEQPETCLIREIQEELNLIVTITEIVDSWLYTISSEIKVVIITYLCKPMSNRQAIKLSHEHKSLLLTKYNNIDQLNMPKGYKNSIKKVQMGNGRKYEYDRRNDNQFG